MHFGVFLGGKGLCGFIFPYFFDFALIFIKCYFIIIGLLWVLCLNRLRARADCSQGGAWLQLHPSIIRYLACTR